jgi:protein involved in polysaccharide export with SLBB domain
MPKVAFLNFSMLALSLLSVLTAGCSSSPGKGLSLFSQAHKLSDEAKDLRQANAPPIAVPRELDKQPLPPYTVEPGDVLLVQPADIDSPVRLPGDQPILPDGTINLGKYGQLMVSGKTVPEIEALVQSAIKVQTKDVGFIAVRIVVRQSKVYYVIGEVNSPGAFNLQGRETVLDAILQAGGLTANASRENIILSRPTHPNCPRIVLPVCWKNIVQLGDTATNYQIAPGDRIYVPTRGAAEMLPGLKKHADRNPCCGPQSPVAFPPYAGGICTDRPNVFNGTAGIVDGLQQGEPIRLPLPAPSK